MQKPNEMSNNEKSVTFDETDDRERAELLAKTIPKELKNWMTNISDKLKDVPVWKLTIPGSHDSGSYGLEIDLGISPDRPDLQRSFFIHAFRCLTMPAIHRWTKTQNLDISGQLNGGIRYLDMRMASKPDDDLHYFCHGLYGPTIDEIFEQINDFLVANPTEIVFIDFQKFYRFSDEDHKRLIKQIEDLFGSRLVPFSSQLMMNQFTLRYLWQHRFQVFVYYRDESARVGSKLLWPARDLPNPWANTMSRTKLMAFLDEKQSSRPPNSMYVTQAILTPTNRYVCSHFYSSLRSDLVQLCNTSISEWIKEKSAGSKGPNIVMSDFIEWNNYDIPLKTIKLNEKFAKEVKN